MRGEAVRSLVGQLAQEVKRADASGDSALEDGTSRYIGTGGRVRIKTVREDFKKCKLANLRRLKAKAEWRKAVGVSVPLSYNVQYQIYQKLVLAKKHILSAQQQKEEQILRLLYKIA